MKKCPICGGNVIDNELFCSHCGMRASFSSMISRAKANLRSTYIFHREKDYNDVKDAVWYGNRDIYNKLDWYGDSSAYDYDCVWVIKIYDNLTQEELEWVVGRIREHGGQYYQH